MEIRPLYIVVGVNPVSFKIIAVKRNQAFQAAILDILKFFGA
jgi:hypothetical protein